MVQAVRRLQQRGPGWCSGGDGCTVQKFRVWGTGEASFERFIRSTWTHIQLERSAGKSQSTLGMGCVQGPPRTNSFAGRRSFWGRGRKDTSLVGQSLHTPPQGRHTRCGVVPLDMLTCGQATPLPWRKGRRRHKGHGGGQLKRSSGAGDQSPRG